LGGGTIFIEGNEDKGVLHEVLVLQKWTQEVLEPDASHGHGSIVSVGGHIGRDEHPLRKLVVLEVLVEHCSVLDISSSLGFVNNRVIQDCGAEGFVSLSRGRRHIAVKRRHTYVSEHSH
jgi:hypothetical protein